MVLGVVPKTHGRHYERPLLPIIVGKHSLTAPIAELLQWFARSPPPWFCLKSLVVIRYQSSGLRKPSLCPATGHKDAGSPNGPSIPLELGRQARPPGIARRAAHRSSPEERLMPLSSAWPLPCLLPSFSFERPFLTSEITGSVAPTRFAIKQHRTPVWSFLRLVPAHVAGRTSRDSPRGTLTMPCRSSDRRGFLIFLASQPFFVPHYLVGSFATLTRSHFFASSTDRIESSNPR